MESHEIKGYMSLALALIIIGAPLYFLLANFIAYKSLRNIYLPSFSTVTFYLFIVITLLLFVPNSLSYATHPKDIADEAKANLISIYANQIKYRSNGSYAGGANAFTLLKWKPQYESNSFHYCYYCGDDLLKGKLSLWGSPINFKKVSDWPFSIRPQSSETGFICMAIANIGDSEIKRGKDVIYDIWMINEKKELYHLSDDITDNVIVDIYDKKPSFKYYRIKKIFNDWINGDGAFVLFEIIIIILLIGSVYKDHKRFNSAMVTDNQERQQ